MKIVLYRPEIPQNAGNIARTCAVTGCDLIMIGPLGFSISNRMVKRAGLDYWSKVNVSLIDSLEDLIENYSGNFYFFSSKAERNFTEVSYSKDDLLIFGCETAGLPERFHQKWPKHFVTIPMKSSSRCLNLSNSVAVAIYEAWRQTGFN